MITRYKQTLHILAQTCVAGEEYNDTTTFIVQFEAGRCGIGHLILDNKSSHERYSQPALLSSSLPLANVSTSI